jgi:DNA-binding Lrp family transcriptional regulator
MTKIDILGKLFGSPTIVKIMRLFLFSPDTPHDLEEIAKRIKSSKSAIKNEIVDLEKAGLIKRRTFFKKTETEKTKSKKTKSKKVQGYILNKNFHYLSALQNLLIKIPPFKPGELENRFKSAGPLKLLVISGVFIQEWDTSMDLLIVGDHLNTASVDRTVSSLESEVGKELSYAVFDTSEFEYRINVYDKLIRDVLDYPHQKIINRLGL